MQTVIISKAQLIKALKCEESLKPRKKTFLRKFQYPKRSTWIWDFYSLNEANRLNFEATGFCKRIPIKKMDGKQIHNCE